MSSLGNTPDDRFERVQKPGIWILGIKFSPRGAFQVAVLLAVVGLIAYAFGLSLKNQAINQVIPRYASVTGILMETSEGPISIRLFHDQAPVGVSNFVALADRGFYDETIFHRVIPGVLIQGGDPLTKSADKRSSWGTGDPGYFFDDEINDIQMVRGVVAYANKGANTNGSQFFIITADRLRDLQGKYTAFGVVVRGMDVVDTIASLPTDQNEVPSHLVRIQRMILKHEGEL